MVIIFGFGGDQLSTKIWMKPRWRQKNLRIYTGVDNTSQTSGEYNAMRRQVGSLEHGTLSLKGLQGAMWLLIDCQVKVAVPIVGS